MNFYTVAARMIKSVERQLGAYEHQDPAVREMAYKNIWELEMAKHERTVELGLRLMEDFKARCGTIEGSRWSLITVRPPHDTVFEQFKQDVDEYIDKWSSKWLTCEYAFEQKGETEDTLGHGFHVHLLISTQTRNYYKSHILKALKSKFTYVSANCIQVDSVKNLDRAKAYIRGEKEECKLTAVRYDNMWREQKGLQPIYVIGQVQADHNNLLEAPNAEEVSCVDLETHSSGC